jgi:flagellar motor switch protein FliM
MLVSLPLHDLLSFTDRVFGGDGAVPEALPEELPLTADLVAGQVEAVLAECFAAVLVPLPVPAVTARVPNLARLEPFAKLAQCCSFVLTVSEDAGPAWSIRLSIAPEAFAVLFAAKPRPVPTAAPRDPQAAPFAELPLELNAVVAEFSLPLARLSGLKCGDTIPLVLSREVPLKVLETTIAYGSVGAADERAALQLTRVF